MDYNTQRTSLRLREYGRHVQELAMRLKSIKDREERNKMAATLVRLMKLVNPDINKYSSESDQKVWDDLYIISDFAFDFEGPYPQPNAKVLDRKPERLNYASNAIKYKHYGKCVQMLIDRAVALEDPKAKEGAVITIGRLMKSSFHYWNKDFIKDEQVLKNIRELSHHQLDIDIDTVKELNLFDTGRRSTSRGRYRSEREGKKSQGIKGVRRNGKTPFRKKK